MKTLALLTVLVGVCLAQNNNNPGRTPSWQPGPPQPELYDQGPRMPSAMPINEVLEEGTEIGGDDETSMEKGAPESPQQAPPARGNAGTSNNIYVYGSGGCEGGYGRQPGNGAGDILPCMKGMKWKQKRMDTKWNKVEMPYSPGTGDMGMDKDILGADDGQWVQKSMDTKWKKDEMKRWEDKEMKLLERVVPVRNLCRLERFETTGPQPQIGEVNETECSESNIHGPWNVSVTDVATSDSYLAKAWFGIDSKPQHIGSPAEAWAPPKCWYETMEDGRIKMSCPSTLDCTDHQVEQNSKGNTLFTSKCSWTRDMPMKKKCTTLSKDIETLMAWLSEEKEDGRWDALKASWRMAMGEKPMAGEREGMGKGAVSMANDKLDMAMEKIMDKGRTAKPGEPCKKVDSSGETTFMVPCPKDLPCSLRVEDFTPGVTAYFCNASATMDKPKCLSERFKMKWASAGNDHISLGYAHKPRSTSIKQFYRMVDDGRKTGKEEIEMYMPLIEQVFSRLEPYPILREVLQDMGDKKPGLVPPKKEDYMDKAPPRSGFLSTKKELEASKAMDDDLARDAIVSRMGIYLDMDEGDMNKPQPPSGQGDMYMSSYAPSPQPPPGQGDKYMSRYAPSPQPPPGQGDKYMAPSPRNGGAGRGFNMPNPLPAPRNPTLQNTRLTMELLTIAQLPDICPLPRDDVMKADAIERPSP